MIAGRGVLLLEAGFVFFINDDQPQSLEGEEDAAPHPDKDIVRLIGKHLLIDLHAFGIGISRVVHAQPVAKDALQPLGKLGRKYDFRK